MKKCLQGRSKYGQYGGNSGPYFDIQSPPLLTQSNFYGSKWLVHVSCIKYYMFYVQPAHLGGISGPKSQF